MSEGMLYTLAPVLVLVPEVQAPSQGQVITWKEKIVWTGIALFLYLICCQIPIYGIYKTNSSDPLYWMRVILASNRGTLMELGISPQVTSNMIVEQVANLKLITYDSKIGTDRKLLQAFEKQLSIIVTFATAFGYVYGGMYGDVSSIGTLKAFGIIVQLTFAGIFVLYLDEMMQKGYGIGSGISLFIAVNICENIVWRAISPVTIKTEGGIEFEGAIVAAIHLFATKSNKMQALFTAFFRQSAPNLNNLCATVFIFLVVIYFQGFRYDVKLRSQHTRGAQQNFPIKLFYLSNTPIILQTALVSNLHGLSHILFQRFRGNAFIRFFGVWKEYDQMSGGPRLVGGLAYYLVPPQSLDELIYDPGHFCVYIIFICASCALFSKLWLDISGRGPKDVCKQLLEAKLYMAERRKDSMIPVLEKWIPIAAIFGGICIGLLSVTADLLGAIGSGTGILLVVNIIYGYIEHFEQENKQNPNKIKANVDF